MRHAFLAAGFVFLGLAMLGLLLPVLPATPFVLLAAACFARASPRFYNWVLNHLMALLLGISIVFFVRPAWLQAALAALGVLLAAWLYTRPSRDRP